MAGPQESRCPTSGFPDFARISGISMPWSALLRMR